VLLSTSVRVSVRVIVGNPFGIMVQGTVFRGCAILSYTAAMLAQTPQWLPIVAAMFGMVLGTAGFVMSMKNYLRDRPRVVVTLRWDMVEPLSGTKSGVVQVTNVGRRPIFISVVALQVPEGFKYTHLVLKKSMPGQKLSEGDAPAAFLANYDGLTRYAARWRDVRGYAEDSAGGKYLSKKLPKSDIPSWGKS
jgi:hypothetical protein